MHLPYLNQRIGVPDSGGTNMPNNQSTNNNNNNLGNKTIYYSRMTTVDMRNQMNSSRGGGGGTGQIQRRSDIIARENSPNFIKCTKL